MILRKKQKSEDPSKAPIPKNRSLWTQLYKIIGLSIAIFILCASIVGLTISFLVDEELIVDQLKKQTKYQINGEIEIDRVSFDIFRGISIDGLKVYYDDPQDYLLKIKNINIDYSFFELFLWNVKVNQIKISDPEIRIIERDGLSSLNKVIEYRQNTFPPKTVDELESKEPFNLNHLPLSPTLLFMPIKLSFNDIGVSNLSFERSVYREGKVVEFLKQENLSIRADFHWFLNSSTLKIQLGNLDEKDFILSLNSENSLQAKLKINSTIEIDDLDKINVINDISIKELNSDKISLSNHHFLNRISLLFENSYKEISIKAFDVALDEILKTSLNGQVSLLEGDFQTIYLRTEQYAKIEIDQLIPFIRLILSDISGKGLIHLKNFKIDGTVNLSQLSDLSKFSPPMTAMNLLIDNLSFKSEAKGLNLQNMNSSSIVSIISDATEGGVVVDLQSETSIDKLEYKHLPEKINLLVKNFQQNILARAKYPTLEMPILKLETLVSEIELSQDRKKLFHDRISLDVFGSGQKSLGNTKLNYEAEIGDLLFVNGRVKVRDDFNELTVYNNLKISNLNSLYSIAKNVLPKEKQILSDLQGSAQITIEANLQTISPIKHKPLEILSRTKGTYQANIELNQFSASTEINNSVVKKLDLAIDLSGNMKETKTNLRLSVDEISSLIESDNPVKIKYIDLTTEIVNILPEVIDTSRLIHDISSNIKTELNVSSINIPKYLPSDLNGLNLTIDGDQENFKKISLKDLTLSVPSLGVKIKSKLEASLDSKMKPIDIDTSVEINMAHNGKIEAIDGVKIDGMLNVYSSLKSNDMKNIQVEGYTDFRHFGFEMKNKLDENIALIEDMHGKIIFSQALNIENIQKKIEGEKKIIHDPIKEFFINRNKKSNTSNIATHINYPQIKPFYPDKKPIHIKRVEVANLVLNDMEIDMEVRENTIALNNFVIGVLGGKVQGNVIVNLDKEADRLQKMVKDVDLSLNLTKLNSHKLIENYPHLKSKKEFNLFGSNPNIDGSVNINFDAISGDISGGIAITSIGKEQLNMIFYYIDPEEKNPSISKIRTALIIGDVREVSVPIKNGEIDIDVDVRLLGAPIPLPKVSQFPVSQMVRNIVNEKLVGGDSEANIQSQ